MSAPLFPLKALDVSEYQGRIDWHKVRRAGYRHAFIKASEGTSEVDRCLVANVRGARRAGLQIGLYHYAHPSQSPRDNARHFLRYASELVKVGDIAPLLDLEVTEGLDMYELWRWQHRWCEIVGEAFATVPMLYSYRYFLEAYIWFPHKHRPIAGADYGRPPAETLAGWHVWQYTSAGRVPGIAGDVDLDLIRKPLPTVHRSAARSKSWWR